jgi:Insertion element 4 transposase N-terminal/Transposase DDE domain
MRSGVRCVTRTVTVAAGVFGPGHLGELTQVIPFGLVDDVLVAAKATERRVRVLPSRVGVYFVLAMCLFPEVGYQGVWRKLTAGLAGQAVSPSEKALRDVRRRVGPGPLKAVFEVLARPLAGPVTPGARFGRFRTVSFDGCSSIRVPDTGQNRAWLGKASQGQGYPLVELMTLVETGTRAILGAVFGPTREGETGYATRLLRHLTADMLVLADRGFDGNGFLASVAATGAQFLVRINTRRRLPVLTVLPDGSFLSQIGGLPVRIIEADVTVTCTDGSVFTGAYRLATTLTDHRHHTATELTGLYQERWEHESAYYALRHTLMNRRTLRSGTPTGLQQEIWALPACYQALRTTMVTATDTLPGTDPDRAGFTIALHTARDQITTATGITPDPTPDHTTTITRTITGNLLPARRRRVSARTVKSPTARYPARPHDHRPATTTTITAITITQRPPRPDRPKPPAPRTYAHRILTLLNTDPDHTWHYTDIATALTPTNLGTLTAQLSEMVKHHQITRPSKGTYQANTPPTNPLTNPPRP